MSIFQFLKSDPISAYPKYRAGRMLFEPGKKSFRSLRSGASWKARKAKSGGEFSLDQFLKTADFISIGCKILVRPGGDDIFYPILQSLHLLLNQVFQSGSQGFCRRRREADGGLIEASTDGEREIKGPHILEEIS